MAILAIGFTNTYLAVNAQGTCVVRRYSFQPSGLLLTIITG